MKVKCINNLSSYPCPLVVGEVYEVRGEHSNKTDWYLVGVEMSWLKTRFEIVDYGGDSYETDCPCGIRRSVCDYHKGG